MGASTVMISSHLLAMIEDVCTHLLVMQNGSVQYFGDAQQLRERFPEAKSLEDAYFAATHESEATVELDVVAVPAITIPITAFQDGAER